MKRWFNIFFQPGAATPPVQLVFFSVVVVSVFQIPTHLMMRAGWIVPGVLANELIAVAGVPLLFIFLLGFDRSKLMPLKCPSALIILVLILFTVGTDIVIEYLTAAGDNFFPMPEHYLKAIKDLVAVNNTRTLVLKFFALCIVPGVCEEVFFRGFCQTSLAARWGTAPAVIISAVMFALLHGNPWYFHLYVMLGLLMGWAYAATGTLVAPIVCHVLNNAWSLLSHYHGMKFPLFKPFGLADSLILLAGIAMSALGAYILYRIMAGRKMPQAA